jgi:hypothetical protein
MARLAGLRAHSRGLCSGDRRTAGPSTSLRFGRDDKGESGTRPRMAGPVSLCGVSRLSKLLNQEDALSALCLKHFAITVTRYRSRCGFAWEKTTTLPFATAESSGGQALMVSRRLGADARANRTGARPSRPSGKTALRCEYLLPQ